MLRHVLVAGFVVVGVASGCATATIPIETEAGPQCGATSTLCGAACAALDRDPQNCGACGTTCKPDEVCSNGKCSFSCGTGTANCNGLCVNEQSDPTNCGICGNKCPAGTVCSAAKCAPTCGAGTTACGSACVDTQVDRMNCGACGTPCPAGEECTGGSCALECQAGLLSCPNDYPDGGAVSDAGTLGATACVDPWVDRFNCGGCGKTCPPATPLCRYGQCVGGCSATQCQQGSDVANANLKWVVCQADCTSAWVSMLSTNGGSYHATYICQQLGYNKLGSYGGTCGDVCSYCQSGTTCTNHGPENFTGGGNCGSDQYGQILCQTVMWQCLM